MALPNNSEIVRATLANRVEACVKNLLHEKPLVSFFRRWRALVENPNRLFETQYITGMDEVMNRHAPQNAVDIAKARIANSGMKNLFYRETRFVNRDAKAVKVFIDPRGWTGYR